MQQAAIAKILEVDELQSKTVFKEHADHVLLIILVVLVVAAAYLLTRKRDSFANRGSGVQLDN